MKAARIACIGWGSLLWDPRTLPTAGAFALDGPPLPIEFSRVSLDGRVTLVIDSDARTIPTYSVRLSVDDLDAAVEALGIREKVAPERRRDWIGFQTRGRRGPGGGDTPDAVRDRIADWLEARALDAVVWTALPSRHPDGRLGAPPLASLVAHLQGLEGEALARAEEYVRRAPGAVRTAHRLHFESELGWSALHPDGAAPTD